MCCLRLPCLQIFVMTQCLLLVHRLHQSSSSNTIRTLIARSNIGFPGFRSTATFRGAATTNQTPSLPHHTYPSHPLRHPPHQVYVPTSRQLSPRTPSYCHRQLSRHSTMGSIATEHMEGYTFPADRLKPVMDDPSKTPLLLVACGSFSPITFLHLRMFIMVRDYVKFSTDFEIVGGYLSPVSDAYKKAGLASSEHRYVSAFR